MHENKNSKVTFSREITRGRHPWLWDADTGKSYRLELENNSIQLNLGPAESRIIVFNKKRRGDSWEEFPKGHTAEKVLNDNWSVELQHSRENWVKNIQMDEIVDLKETEHVRFTGTAIYRKNVNISQKVCYLNLGKVWGVCELFLNGKSQGVKWYGDRIYKLTDGLINGKNSIEVRVITTMGNYMQTLKENKTAQKYTNRPGREQLIQSMGIVGPVKLY